MSAGVYSKESLGYLVTCDPYLQQVFKSVLQFFDHKILCGHRPKEEQDAAFNSIPQRSKVPWPKGRHNTLPSEAIDAVVYPIGTLFDEKPDPRDIQRQIFFAGYVLAFAAIMGKPLRWGGDWDADTDFKDQTFNDYLTLKSERSRKMFETLGGRKFIAFILTLFSYVGMGIVNKTPPDGTILIGLFAAFGAVNVAAAFSPKSPETPPAP